MYRGCAGHTHASQRVSRKLTVQTDIAGVFLNVYGRSNYYEFRYTSLPTKALASGRSTKRVVVHHT